MSKKLLGSGGSHSFGGSEGGPRSFGGSTPGRSTRHLSGSGGISGRSVGDSSDRSVGDFSGVDPSIVVASAVGLGVHVLGLPGGIIVLVSAILVYLGINHPKAFGISLTIGIIVILLVVFLWPRKKEKPDPGCIADLLADGDPKYDRELIHTEDFARHMLAELSDRDFLTKRGFLRDDRIDMAVRSFDEIYRKYNRDGEPER